MAKATKEQLEELYKQGKSQNEIGQLIGIGQSEVSRLFQKYGIKSRNVWTKEDLEYLEENYGKYSLSNIGKKTGKSEVAVKIKAKRLGLGGVLNASDKIVATQLANLVKVDTKTLIRWIKLKGLKATNAKLAKRKFYMIDINDFWKWAKDNKEFIKWRELEVGFLGAEPKWTAAARKECSKIPKQRKWTVNQDKLLVMYFEAGKTYKEIARLLNRTDASIQRRIARKGFARRIELPWKPIEDKMLITMKNKGFTDEKIAEELGRSLSSTIWKRKELCKKGLIDWTYRNNKKVTQVPTKATEVTL